MLRKATPTKTKYKDLFSSVPLPPPVLVMVGVVIVGAITTVT
jgi:hypothetical protein